MLRCRGLRRKNLSHPKRLIHELDRRGGDLAVERAAEDGGGDLGDRGPGCEGGRGGDGAERRTGSIVATCV